MGAAGKADRGSCWGLRASGLAVAASAFLLCAFGAGSLASAAEYRVDICSPTAHETETMSVTFGGGGGLDALIECGTPFGGIHLVGTNSVAAGSVNWRFLAPGETRITEVDFDEAMSPSPWNPSLRWTLGTNMSTLQQVEGGPTPNGHFHMRIPPSQLIDGQILCRSTPECSTPNPRPDIRLSNIAVGLEDSRSPIFRGDPGGSLLTGVPVRGLREVSFHAEDRGSGVSGSQLVLDGVEGPFIPDQNGGRCVEPIRFMLPCKRDLRGSLPVDTTHLSEGQHKLKIAIFDAVHNSTESSEKTFVVHNAPIDLLRPALEGTPKVGEKLSATQGIWEGTPTTYTYQWLRCPPNVGDRVEAGCQPIAGAGGADYVVKEADGGARLVARVTATNATGSEPALSLRSPLVPKVEGSGNGRANDTTPPALTGLSLTHKRFRAGKAPNGTLLRFNSSEAATLSVRISKVKSKKPLLTLTRKIAAGAGKLAFSGQTGGKSLKAGRYSLSVSAKDAAGNTSKPVKLTMSVLPS